MKLHTRLGRLEAGLHATVQRLTGEVVATINTERTEAERRATSRVLQRVLELHAAGVPCPLLPSAADAEADGDAVRLSGDGPVLATGEEWALYLPVADRIRELWTELNGPCLGMEAA